MYIEERIKRIEKALNLPAFKDHEWEEYVYEEYVYGTGYYDRTRRCKWCRVSEALKHRNCVK